jgi:hypothetical protein
MVTFRKCELCGRALEGPEAGQEVVEHRGLDPAQDALLQREIPGDLPADSVCDECLAEYRRRLGGKPQLPESHPG